MLIFVDSFGHYTNSYLQYKWDLVDYGAGTSTLAQSLTSGRFGGGGVTFASTNSGDYAHSPYMVKNYDGVGTIICGMALVQTGTQESGSIPGNVTGGRWLTFLSGNTVQVRLAIQPSGQIQVTRGNNANEALFPNVAAASKFTTLGTSTDPISASTYDFLEVQVVHHPSTGSVTIKKAGSVFYSLTNVNTDIAGTTNSSAIVVGGGTWGSGGTTYSDRLKAIISDFYLLNTTVNGSDSHDPITFLGDVHWEPLPPTADGFYTEWSTQGSGSHYANIDEIPPNSDGDYNFSSTVNQRDTFVVDDSSGVIGDTAIVALTMFVEKTAGGSNQMAGLSRLAGTDRLGTAYEVPAGTGYAFRQSFSCTAPGGAQWTVGNYNSSQQGYKKVV